MSADLDAVIFRDLHAILQKTLNWTAQNLCRAYKTYYTTIRPRYFVSFCWKIPNSMVGATYSFHPYPYLILSV